MTDSPSACDCDSPQDPQVVTNPPGLSTIADRVDDFSGFRQALLTPQAGEQVLAGWRPTAGDLGLQVLEWWAYLGDVLTFYNERIANESYLRTAKSARRLSDLVALIGYTPRPGIGATGQVALLRTAAHPNEPLWVPDGMALSSTATPGVPAQTFEVAGGWEFPGPSDVQVALAPDEDLVLNDAGGPASVLLAGRVTTVKTADQLLLAAQGWDGSSDDNWAWVQVAGVQPSTDPATGAQNTLVSFSSSARFGPPPVIDWRELLGETERYVDTEVTRTTRALSNLMVGQDRSSLALDESTPAGASRSSRESETVVSDAEIRRPTGIYWSPGTSAPAAATAPQAPAFQLLRPTQTASLWNQANPPGAVIDSSTSPITAHLNAAVRSITPGQLVLFDGAAAGVALATVANASEVLWAVPYPPGAGSSSSSAPPPTSPPAPTPTPPPNIVVAHSALGLTTPDENVLTGFWDPKVVTLRYGFKPVGSIIGTPVASLSALPATVQVPSGWSPADSTQTAILQDSTGLGVEVAVTSAGDGDAALGPSGATPAALPTPLYVPLTVLLDLVPVTRGTTVASETLGSGNGAATNQSFALQRSPLTYLSDGSGISSTLVVYVGGVAWTEVPSLFGQDPAATVYTVTLAPDGSATVTFGDGVNGARLPSGSGNVVARYRYGSGVAAPPVGRLTTVTRPQPNLASVANPIAVFGGLDPQAPDDVRQNAPASVATFGRAISGTDYGVVAGQAPGVTRVGVVWSFDDAAQRTTVTVYVGGGSGAVAAAMNALAGAEDPNRPVTVVGATAVPLSISCTLQIDPSRIVADVQAAAIAALSDPAAGPLSQSAPAIGQPLYRSQIDAALSVDGVLAVAGLTVSSATEVMDKMLSPGPGSYFTLGSVAGIQGVPGD